ncbi:hypothetical protein KDW10_30505 [Burkholderia vietnamiensis]|uniref:hypothetical protein n=1 Tax=Burkholderia vietnamiensis TaxID=60552 RepID=UPI001B902E37|nr:hypothetical protein [Burkholderia vietnamiensis]MBR8361663.1 hypothetical protein [Burkholderia vietnamiensis]
MRELAGATARTGVAAGAGAGAGAGVVTGAGARAGATATGAMGLGASGARLINASNSASLTSRRIGGRFVTAI